jgi:hypothetical protein
VEDTYLRPLKCNIHRLGSRFTSHFLRTRQDATVEDIYLRSDDDPSLRTEMSGEALLRGMFRESRSITLPWHMGDFDLDYIYPNHKVRRSGL